MSWTDRLREAAYTPPSGTRLTFAYQDVSRETAKRTTAFEFPGVDGAYVQDHGSGARQYPLRCFFSGPTHDLDATRFELALLERGAGRLEHPFYGAVDVVPFGTISRRDALVTEANQSVVEVTFWSTIGALYPTPEGDPRNELAASLDVLDETMATSFAEAVDLRSAVAKTSVRANTRSLLRIVAGIIGTASGAVSTVNRAFRESQVALNYGMDVLIGQPLQLAQQIVNLVNAPALAVVGLEMRMADYRRLADRIYATAAATSFDDIALAGTKLRLTNAFHTADLFATATVAGSLRSIADSTFADRPSALRAANEVLAQFDALVAWREANFARLGRLDTGASYQALQQAVALTTGYLVQTSFELVTERRIVLDRARTIIDLAAELFGSVDDRLDALIATNNLTGSEILELPAGRTIAYYV